MSVDNTKPVLHRIDGRAAEATPRFPWSRPLVGYVRDRLVRVWPRERHTCTATDACSHIGVRYCPQCDGYVCLRHSAGGVTKCCGVHAWETTWDRHEHGQAGVIDAKTRVLISLGGEYALPHEVLA